MMIRGLRLSNLLEHFLIYGVRLFSDLKVARREADVPIGSSSKGDVLEGLPGLDLADEIFPDRCRSIEDWMRKYNYSGEHKATLKLQEGHAQVTSGSASQD
jgi:hypothetical protein